MTGADEIFEMKKDAVSFLKLASSGMVSEAYARFVGEGFRHHNPFFEGSAESLQAAMESTGRPMMSCRLFQPLRSIRLTQKMWLTTPPRERCS